MSSELLIVPPKLRLRSINKNVKIKGRRTDYDTIITEFII